MNSNVKERSHIYQTETLNLNDQKKVQMFSNIQLNGSNTHPLYKYLRTNSILYNPVKKNSAFIQANFTKFLVDRFGNVIQVYSQNSNLQKLEQDLENLLLHT